MVVLNDVILFNGNGGEIWTVNPDGTGLTQVTVAGTGDGSGWAWASATPDGTQIVAGTFLENIFVMSADGSVIRQITNMDANIGVTFASQPVTFSPDGSQFVAPARDVDDNATACFIRLDNSGFTSVALPTYNGGGTDRPGVIRWSPDGTKLLFPDNPTGSIGTSVCNVDGSGLTSIVEGGGSDVYRPWGWFADSVNQLIQGFSSGILKTSTGLDGGLLVAPGVLTVPDLIALSPDNLRIATTTPGDESGLSVLTLADSSIVNIIPVGSTPSLAETDYISWVGAAVPIPPPPPPALAIGNATSGHIRVTE